MVVFMMNDVDAFEAVDFQVDPTLVRVSIRHDRGMWEVTVARRSEPGFGYTKLCFAPIDGLKSAIAQAFWENHMPGVMYRSWMDVWAEK